MSNLLFGPLHKYRNQITVLLTSYGKLILKYVEFTNIFLYKHPAVFIDHLHLLVFGFFGTLFSLLFLLYLDYLSQHYVLSLWPFIEDSSCHADLVLLEAPFHYFLHYLYSKLFVFWNHPFWGDKRKWQSFKSYMFIRDQIWDRIDWSS